MMKLYSYFRSSAAYRVRIALNLKGIEYDVESKSLRTGEHLADDFIRINPQGFVPALEIEGTVLGQSLAILEYLEERFPVPMLLPKHPVARAQVRGMALAIACDIHPLNNLRVLNYLKSEYRLDESRVDHWYRHWIEEGFRPLETLVKRHSKTSRHCFGEELSIADVCLVPQMFNARRLKADLTPFPTLVAISTALEAHPAFAAARPEVQPDAVSQ
jgi:maleylacetoacetate isomerase